MADLHDVSRVLRRALLRHRRLIAATLAAAAVVASAQVMAAPVPARSPVAVAAQDLTGGGVVRPDDVEVVMMPPDVVPHGARATPRDLVGETLAAPMRAGEPFTDRRLVGEALVAGYPAGTVVMPVRISDRDAVSLLRVGDRVDVYASTAAATGRAARLVRGGVVVALPRVEDDGVEGALVALAVDSVAASALAQAAASAQLSVSLRE